MSETTMTKVKREIKLLNCVNIINKILECLNKNKMLEMLTAESLKGIKF